MNKRFFTRPRAFALAALTAFAVATPVATASSGGIGTVTPTAESAQATTGTDQQAGGGGGRYDRLWSKVSRRDRRWAHRTAMCESGLNPRAIGGGGIYRGAFQFMRQTWATSPKSPGGDPIDYSYKTQAVVAVALMHREGTSPWPVCG